MKTLCCFVFIVSVLFIAVHHTFAQDLTFTTNTLNAGGLPVHVVAADVNGDGKLDLICANQSGYSLTIFTNDGHGNFGSNATIDLSPFFSPNWVAAAEINGDGQLDLICSADTSSEGGYLLTITNNGSGSFVIARAYRVQIGNFSFTPSVAAADVNGDSKLDFISANKTGHSLTVMTNNGSGGFNTDVMLYAKGPFCVVAADINGDGKVDLISAQAVAGALIVWTNDGCGLFGSNATLNANSNPYCVVAADINNDGRPDLISANNTGYSNYVGTLTVLTNNGSGLFGSNAMLSVSSSRYHFLGPYCVVAADINGDGKLDLINANTDDNTLTVLTNNGNGAFGSNTILNVGSGPYCVVAADINGDGRPDLISANINDNTLTVLINTSTFPPPTFTPTLNITRQGNDIQVAWPSDSPGWSLQQTPDLTKMNWLPSGYEGWPVADDGTNKSLTLPLPTGGLFFRLLHP